MSRRTKSIYSNIDSITSHGENSLVGDTNAPSLGYAQGLNKESAQKIFDSADFLQDASDYYFQRDGKTFSNKEEIQDYFMSDRRWRNMNTISIGRDLMDANTQSDEQTTRLARLQGVFDALPNFYEEGGDGWKGFGENAAAALLDPINLIGYGSGGAAAKAAAAAAMASGATRTAAKRAGLKAGFKKGAIAEGIASGIVEGVADQGIQRRNVEIGLQDEVSYLQTGAAIGIGTATGGVLGGFFGTAGAVNPLRPGGKSKIAEGMLEGAQARRTAANITSGRSQARADAEAGVTPDDQPIARFSSEEKADVASKMTARLNRLEADRIDAEPTTRAENDLEVDAEVEANDVQVGKIAVQRMQNLDEAAKANKQKAQEASAKGDTEEAAKFERAAVAQEQKSNSLQVAIERILREDSTTTSDDVLMLKNESDSAEPLLALTYDPDAPQRTTMPDGSPVRDATKEEELFDKVNIPVRNENREQFRGQNAPEVEPEDDVVTAAVDERVAETEMNNADKEVTRLTGRKEMLQKNLETEQAKQQAFDKGEEGAVAPDPEVSQGIRTELAEIEQQLPEAINRQTEKKQIFEDARSRKREVMASRAAPTEEVSDIEGTAQGANAKADSDVEVENPTEDFTPDNIADTTPTTVSSIVDLLEALGDNPVQIRKELKALGDGRKPEVKAKRREFLRERLTSIYAQQKMLNIMDLVSSGDEKAIFHVPTVKQLLLEEADSPDIGERMLQNYETFVGNRAARLFITHLESTGADPSRALELIRQRYGDEMVEIMLSRLDKGGANMAADADPERLRVLFKSLPKDVQERMRAMEAAVVADMMKKDPDFVEAKAREIVVEMTELKLERELRKGNITTKRSDSVINTHQAQINDNVKELRALRQQILKGMATLPKRVRPKVQAKIVFKNNRDYISYLFEGGEPPTAEQQEVVDAIIRSRQLMEQAGFKGQTIGEVIEKLNERSSNLEQMRGKDIVVYANNQMRGTNDFSVADEFAANAIHMGTQRRQGLGTYTVYGKEVRGGDVIRKAQGLAKKANKFGYTQSLRDFGAKVDADGRVHRVGSAIHALDQILNASIAAANNRVVRDPVKAARNEQELAPIEQAIKDFNRVNGKIKRLDKKISAAEADPDKVAELEAQMAELNEELTQLTNNSRGLYLEVDSFDDDDVLKSLKAAKRRLTQSTGVEAAGNKAEEVRANQSEILIRQEIIALKKRLNTINRRKSEGEDGSKMSADEEQQIMTQIQRLNAELDKAVISDKRLERVLNKPLKDNVRAEKAAERLLAGDDMPKQDYVGEVTPEIADQATAIAGEVQRKASAEQTFARRFMEISDSDLPDAAKLEAMKNLRLELQSTMDATKSPNLKPANKKHKPHMVVVDGIEVDANNDFTYTKSGNRVEVGFDGERVGYIQELSPNQILFVRTLDASDDLNARMFSTKAALRDQLPVIMKDRIKAKQQKTEQFDVRPNEEGMAYPEPDFRKTETYRNEPTVPDEPISTPDPIEQPRVASDPNDPLTFTEDDFDIPPMRDIAVQIIDPNAGKAFGQIRVFSRKQKQTLGQVLKTSSKYKYVVGTVEAGARGKTFKAQETFKPLNPEEEYVPHNSNDLVKAADVEPVARQTSAKVRANRPIEFDKLEEIPVDKETLSFTASEINIKNLADLQKYSDYLDFREWSKLKSIEGFQEFVELRKRVATELKRYAPNGIRRPAQQMRDSMANLTQIMDNISPAETQAAVDFMMRIARQNGGDAPIFIERMANRTGNQARYDSTANEITLRPESYSGRFDEQNHPSTFKVVHEIGHWVYFNMLDDADRIEFWGAMQKYYNEEGLDVNALTKRADILGDGGRKSNTLLSPQEFFANQFTLWASRSGMVPNLSLWDKIARMGAKLLDMITGKNQLDLDPDLVPLFQRAIPPLGIDPVTGVSNQGISPFAHLAKFGKEYGKDGGNKAYVFGKAMNDLDIMRHDLMSAVGTSSYAASDATALAETLKTVGRRMYGMVGGKRNDTHHPDFGRSKTVIDADGSSRHVEQGNARLRVLAQMPAYERFIKAQHAIYDYLDTLQEAGAMRETKDGILGSLDLDGNQQEKLNAMIDRQFEEMESPGSFDAQTYALSALNASTPYKGLETKAVMHLHRLAQEAILAHDEMISDVSKAFTRQIPRSGREFVTVEIREGVNKGRMYQSRNQKTRHYQQKAADAEAKRQEEYWNIKGFVQAVNAQRNQRFENYADPVVSDSTKNLDSDALAREGASLPKESKRAVDIANELKDRSNAKVLNQAEELSEAEQKIVNSMVDEESARKVLDAAMGMQNNPDTSAMASRLIRVASQKLNDMGIENPLPITEPKVSDAIQKTIDAKSGTDDTVGIDADTPASIREYAKLLTNRDQRSSYIGRQVFQRMMTLMGYDSVNQYSANVMLGRSVAEFGDNDEALIPSNSEEFIGVIKRMRQISKAAQSDDDTVAYEMVAESLFHSLSSTEQAAIAKFAGHNGFKAVDFWKSQVARLVKTGKLSYDSEIGQRGWLQDANALNRVMRREAQSVSFVLNGLVDHNKADFMVAYGDVFARARVNSPHVSAADAVNRNAVSPAVAGRYSAELISTLSGKQEQAAREFLGIKPQNPLRNHVMFNTPEMDASGAVEAHRGDYGTGVYLKGGDKVDSGYRPSEFIADMDAKFNSAGLTGNEKEAATQAVRMIVGLRERIKQASAGGKPKGNIRDLLFMEDLQWRIINAFAPSITDNKVIPVYVRSSNAFDFTSDGTYALISPSENNIAHIIADMAKAGLIEPEGVTSLQNMLGDGFSGRELHAALTDPRVGVMHKHGNSANDVDAKDKLSAFLNDYGYDAINTDDGMVVWNVDNVRHVKNGFTESELTNHLPEDYSGDLKTGANLAAEMYYSGKPVDKGTAPAVAAELQQSGTPQAVSDLAIKILKGQNLDASDVEKSSVFSTVRNFFTENSKFFRGQGANWFGDAIKPLNGTGLFEAHDVELNKLIAPIFAELNKLPGNRNGFNRWARKNVEFINQIGQPPSHRRILEALREGRGAVERLDPQERQAALKIAATFEKELNQLRALGIPVGDARRYGNDFYVPQVWDSEAVLANPNKFKAAIKNYLIREMRDPNTMSVAKTGQELDAKVNQIFDSITSENGVIDGNTPLVRSLSDPMTTRMLRLQKQDFPELHAFLVNDLSGLLARYFDRTVRKRMLTKKFGLQGHGFDSYKTIIQRGPEAAADILRSSQNLIIRGDTLVGKADTENNIIPKLELSEDASMDLIRAVKSFTDRGDKQSAHTMLLNAAPEDVRDNPQYRVRVDAIVNALTDFPAGNANRHIITKMEEMNNVLNKRPLDGSDGNALKYKFVRNLKAFNSVSLLGFTTLTSIPDIALPLIRSGNMTAFLKAWGQYMTDPNYRAAAKNIGVGIENLLHDRMVQMAGEGSQKFTNSFFNFTLLTPWTNMQREVAAMVGYEAFRTELNRAISARMNGRKDSRGYQQAVRFLERYGLTGENAEHDFLAPGSYRLEDIPQDSIIQDQVKRAMLRFTNEAIFTPNPNDVPMWAQTPWGSLMFQLKSFPLMMSRLSRDVLVEASKGNVKPLAYMATAGVGLGMLSLGVKDLVQMRGGEDEQSSAFRERRASKLIPIEEGGDYDERLGWYLEGMMAMGGLGLFAEMFYNISAQLDNGKYGYVRTMSYVFGPAVGTSEAVFDVGAGIGDALMGDADKNSKERQAARQVAGRVPVLGGVRAFREGAADLFGEPGKRGSGKSQGFGNSNFGNSNFGKGKFGS